MSDDDDVLVFSSFCGCCRLFVVVVVLVLIMRPVDDSFVVFWFTGTVEIGVDGVVDFSLSAASLLSSRKSRCDAS